MLDRPVIILGAGGHGRVLADALLAAGNRILGFTDNDPNAWGRRWLDIPVIGGDALLANYSAGEIYLVNGLGSVALPELRRKIFERQKLKRYIFASVVHPGAIVSSFSELGEGVQIMAGAIVQTGVKLANNVILNTGAIVDHDSIIGQHSHIGPGATLSGGVKIGESCHIGTGTVIIQGIEIGGGSMVGAGTVVIRDHPPNSRLIGVPARMLGKS